MRLATEPMAHAGRSDMKLVLRDYGIFEVSTTIYATGISPNKCWIVAIEQNGIIRVLQRSEPDAEEVACFSTIFTDKGNCSFITIDDEAKFILLIDWDGWFHIFSRHINDWEKEPVGFQIGLFLQAAHTFTARFVTQQEGDNPSAIWVLQSNVDDTQYVISRHSRLWRGHHWRVITRGPK